MRNLLLSSTNMAAMTSLASQELGKSRADIGKNTRQESRTEGRHQLCKTLALFTTNSRETEIRFIKVVKNFKISPKKEQEILPPPLFPTARTSLEDRPPRKGDFSIRLFVVELFALVGTFYESSSNRQLLLSGGQQDQAFLKNIPVRNARNSVPMSQTACLCTNLVHCRFKLFSKGKPCIDTP